MAENFIGERITPQSKYSVQYGIVYKNNQIVKNEKKAKKILERYKNAIEKNWIIRISSTLDYLERTIGKKYLIIFFYDSYMQTHYIVKKDINGWRIRDQRADEKGKMNFPFHLEFWRGNSEKFTREEAELVRKKLINIGLGEENVLIEKYNPGLSDTYVDFTVSTNDSIEDRFKLMDFEAE